MSSTLPYGVVVYSDGSARPNPGYHGSGLHGYSYRLLEEGEHGTKINAMVATDEGYVFQKDVTDLTVCVEILEYLDSFTAYSESGTNNIAEINAITLFFEHYPELAATIKKLHVVADSQYAIGGATSWIDGWKRGRWIKPDGKEVSNKEQWMRLSEHLDRFKEGAQFSMSWVKGHMGDFGNTKADYLAGIGTNHSADGLATSFVERSPAKGYHKTEVKMNPMLGFKRFYFNTVAEYNQPGVYYQTSWSGPSFILGKRSSEAAFSVVRLKEPDPVLGMVIARQEEFSSDYNTLVYAKGARLTSPDVHPWLEKHGKYCVYQDARCLNMNFLDQKPLTIEVSPGELPLRAIDVLNHMEEILDHFQEATGTGSVAEFNFGGMTYGVHDVTSHFYNKIEKKVGKSVVLKTELAKTIVNNMKNTEIEVNEEFHGKMKAVKLLLLFSDDMPSRNSFKRLEEVNPEVFLITWKESESVLRYATLIKTDDGVGIWSNYFANQIVVKA